MKSRMQLVVHCLLLLVYAILPTGSHASGDYLVQSILDLPKGDKDDRQKIYERLEKEGDERLVPLLEAYQAGLLADRDGKLLIYGPRVQGPDQRKLYPLLDALTSKPLVGKDGNPEFSQNLGQMLRAERQDRKTIASVIKVLSLQHSNPEKRTAAIVAAGDRADASMLPALKQQLKGGSDREFVTVLEESIARIELVHGQKADKMRAAQILARSGSSRAAASLGKARESAGDDEEFKAVLEASLHQVRKYQ